MALLDSKSLKINPSPIIDLTNQLENVIGNLKLEDNGSDIELKELEYLPNIIDFELLNKVSIKTNRLESVRLDILAFLQHLNYLTIQFTEPIEINKNLFTGLDKLKMLKINGLIGVKNEVFAGLTRLECLDLSDNNIQDLEPNAWTNWKLLFCTRINLQIFVKKCLNV